MLYPPQHIDDNNFEVNSFHYDLVYMLKTGRLHGLDAIS